jgi:hypothetical protein
VQYLYLQGDDHLTFEGGGMILKKHFLQGYYEQKNTCTNKLGGKISCPSIWWGKMLQNSMVAGFDLTSPR